MKIGRGLIVFFCAAALCRPLPAASWQKVQIKTKDGVTLVGLFHPPAGRHLTWVFLHGLGSTKGEWQAFADKAVAQNDGILIYDMRGHGESVQGPKGLLDYHDAMKAGPGSLWVQMPGDLKTVIAYLKTQYGIAPTRVGLGGASLGANVALQAASDNPDIPAVFLLSPGFEYAGISTQASFIRYGRRPLLVAASPEDLYAHATLLAMADARKDGSFVQMDGPGAAHGVAMFGSKFTPHLLAWMKEQDQRWK